jgi:hypothetical protein
VAEDTTPEVIKKLTEYGYTPVRKLKGERLDETLKRVGKAGLMFSTLPLLFNI